MKFCLRASRLSFNRILLFVALIFITTFLAFFPVPRLGYFNWTRSMPKGFYLLIHEPVTNGSIVVIPSSKIKSFGQRLPGYLLKQVFFCQPTDTLTINTEGLYVANLFTGDTKLAKRKILNIGVSFIGPLGPGQALLFGQTERSFDSRYFGPVYIADLSPVRPFLTW